MHRKGFTPLIVIGIIAVIVVAGVVGYFAWKSSSNGTSSWQVYTNQQHGFQIKIPSNWTCYPLVSSFSVGCRPSNKPLNVSDNSNYIGDLQMQFYSNEGMSIPEYSTQNNLDFFAQSARQTSTTINGNETDWFYDVYGSIPILVVIDNEEKLKLVEIIDEQDASSDATDFNAIASSFQFTQ